jgi:transcriptional regulator with XRE-family HTH domain
MGTDQPFADAIRALLVERGLTFRALATRTAQVDPHSDGLTHSYLATLGKRDRPSPRAMEIVARALDLEPTYFAEYRLALIRGLFDEDQQGLAGGLENLEALRELLDAHGSEPPAGRLAKMLAAADSRRRSRAVARTGPRR